MGNIVAIVGRPNVGKSTLFNRLTESRAAIVDGEEGVTRDRHYGTSEWNGKTFSVIDTGGYVTNSEDVFEEAIRKQAAIAMDEADVILFMVDVQNGITDLDQSVANILRRINKPVLLVVNKVDNNDLHLDATEFYGLGYEKLYSVSSNSGSGTGDLLDEVTNLLPEQKEEETEEELPRFAVVGRPNAGKSLLVNTLLGEDRNIVTDISGTTRDAIYTRYNKFDHDFYLVDTAGLRKKSKVREDLEFYSVMRSVRVIEYADVCLVMIDATKGIESQDVNILHLAVRNNKGVVVLINKWDLIEKQTDTAKKMETEIKNRLSPFEDVPIIFISALTKQRIFKALETATKVYENRNRKIKTSQLNDYLLPLIERTPPPSIKGKYIKIKYVAQLPTPYPAFAFYCNLPQYVKEPYRRFLVNQLRKGFNFTGVPIKIFIRKK
ncbi:MAG TPA: ribosome biogenesis GTPase Der [Salinivirga sp.]|uniref:ribosome biogenesis GTPase Der n=1 Tax=Salinivirga sp. TaxID=1970192 RepID=UPI002B460B93|nr:ribosome biogenesis GTPase Der [Salinivirga sp.]HKK57889.1 ribosome biogenesis GTPase Der [Salinivirga sp.]